MAQQRKREPHETKEKPCGAQKNIFFASCATPPPPNSFLELNVTISKYLRINNYGIAHPSPFFLLAPLRANHVLCAVALGHLKLGSSAENNKKKTSDRLCYPVIQNTPSQSFTAEQAPLEQAITGLQASSRENPCSSRFGGKDVKVNFSTKPKLAVTSPQSPDEQTLKVKMPQGSTERSKKLIAKQKQTAATAVGRFELLFQKKYTPLAINCSFRGKRTKCV